MSKDRKENETLRSTLSADVPPFVPRNCNVGLLTNTVLARNGMDHTPQYIEDTSEARDSKWHIPVIPPSSSGIMLLPVTPVLHPEYKFQSSSQDDGILLQPSHFQSANTHFPSQGKKKHNRKYPEVQPVVDINKINLNNDSFSNAPSENEKRQKETLGCLNSKIKINRGKDNVDKQKSQLKLMTTDKSLKCAMKLDNNIEFPSLPEVSNKDNLQNQIHNNETYQPAQHCSYSSILQSTPNPSSYLNQRSDVSTNDNSKLKNAKEEKLFHKSMHRKQKTKSAFEAKKTYSDHCKHDEHNADDKVENEQNYNIKSSKNHKSNRYQNDYCIADMKESSSKSVEFILERNKSLQKKCERNNIENSQQLNIHNGKSINISKEECNATDQVTKAQKSKKKKHNKKKKKSDPGKVSLLSPEVFATITNKLNEVSKVNQNDSFNLCDQQDFPTLDSSSLLAPAAEKLDKEKLGIGDLKQNKTCLMNNASSEKPLSLNLWKPMTYSDILQATNKFRSNEKEAQKGVESMKSPYDSKKEDTLVTVSKKKEKKKKKKNSAASGSSKKVHIDNKKQGKPDSVIQISLATMVTSLQQVKLNQLKKKETKTRVISTKRGIMDKIANPHNMLDSSAPMKKRGKEREKPGRKRLSAMRKVILRERERRRMQNLERTKYKSEDEVDINKGTDDANESQSFADICESSNEVDGKHQASKIILHTKKFRDYCDHMISEEIDSTVMSILKDLVRFQDRLHEKDPIKARMKRRLVYGLREVTKHLRLCKLKCIIVAPNIEKISSEGGLSDALQIIIKLAQEQSVPYVFALQRRALGKVCMKIVPISCVGIFNYEGVEENYHKLLEFLTEAREKYNETLKLISTYITEEEVQLLLADISPAEIQPIRSEVLHKIAMHNTVSESVQESGVENSMKEYNIDQNTDTYDIIENISEETQQFIQNKETVQEINSEE